ncbi:MAG TPA: type III pantothenate kinase [Gemmataceae bacterium]|nr:type III pantothenate kinase [Gemmataceae bacterium]
MLLVADIGNTRIKWGQCNEMGISRSVSMPDDSDAWETQLTQWRLEGKHNWVLASVQPARTERLADFLHGRGHAVRVLQRYSELPLALKVEKPEQVGLDRLLNVLGAKAFIMPGTPSIVVDAGSAVTVDLLDDEGAFAGGSIFPGLRLMAEALHEHTALLPLVDMQAAVPLVPAGNTTSAIAAGVHWAVAGGISALVRAISLTVPCLEKKMPVFLTGGDAAKIQFDFLDRDLFEYQLRPTLTLEGIRIAALAIP